jgi:CheY-like chemotaxis protein
MKRILVACDPASMDAPLRRSLAHLVKSCEIDVVHDGYAAFEELSAHPFDLLVFDFSLSGIDSLELVESVQYIDPGVPVILLLQAAHKSMRESASLKAHPMLCPFKPLKFLRLVDKLLHQQLNRYRQLAGALETALEALRQQTGTPCVFLVEENGQLLLTKGELGADLVDALGNLVVGLAVLDEEMDQLFSRDETLYHHYHTAPKDHGLYVIPLTANLRLALLSPLATEVPESVFPLAGVGQRRQGYSSRL